MIYFAASLLLASAISFILAFNQFTTGETVLGFMSLFVGLMLLGDAVLLYFNSKESNNIHHIKMTDKKSTKVENDIIDLRNDLEETNKTANYNTVPSSDEYSTKDVDNKHSISRNKYLLVSFILGLGYLIYLVYYIYSTLNAPTGNGAYDLGTAIGVAMIYPHLALLFVAVVFNGIGWYFRMRWSALTGAIFYILSIVFMPLYFLFVITQAVLSFIGYSKMNVKK